MKIILILIKNFLALLRADASQNFFELEELWRKVSRNSFAEKSILTKMTFLAKSKNEFKVLEKKLNPYPELKKIFLKKI